MTRLGPRPGQYSMDIDSRAPRRYTIHMTNTCPACSYANSVDARFCGACGLALSSDPAASGGASSKGPFVGRGRELDVLFASLNDAWIGNGRIAMLVGEAGIGKTTIAQAFAVE